MRKVNFEMILVLSLCIMVVAGIVTPSMRPHSFENAIGPKYGGTLIVAQRSDVRSLNPSHHSHAFSQWVSTQIFNALLSYDLEGWPKPDLAESWEISTDGLTYTFHLVRNATWHDGVPFTSADVKYSFEEVILPYHPSAKPCFGCVKSIETPDDYTVVFKLKYVFPPIMRYMGLSYAGIIPKHIYEGTDPLTNPHNYKDPVGTGPFKLVEWVKGSHLVLVRNPNYFKEGKPYLDRVVFKIMPTAEAMVVALEKGAIDYIGRDFPRHEVERISRIPGLNATSIVYFKHADHLLSFNLVNPILSHLKVRQAFAHAINRDVIFEKVYYKVGKMIEYPLGYYLPDVVPAKYEYDLERANRLLDEAGFPRGPDGIRFELSLRTSAARSEWDTLCDILRDEFGKLGVKINIIKSEDAANWDAVYNRRDFELALQPPAVGPHPISLMSLFHSSYIGKGIFSNGCGYNNSRVDSLLEKVAGEPDPKKEKEYYAEIQEKLLEDLPVIWLYEWSIVCGFKTEYHGLPPGCTQRDNFESVWWEKGSEVSPESASKAVLDAEDDITRLKSQYYDVTEALAQIEKAKEALEAGDYASAFILAKEAPRLAKPPYPLYAGIAVVIVVVVVAAILVYRKRKAS